VVTTDEHPFFVEGRGFTAAKELGIGTSIVTRAGPYTKVIANRAQLGQTLVYNLTVTGIDTYFVGNGEGAVWVHNAACGETPSSEKLGRNMEDSGIERPDETAAHHIVAGSDPRAAIARGILKKAGIGINDAENGVFLPRFLTSLNEDGSMVHSTLHTDDYYKAVDNALLNAPPGGVPDALEDIRSQLLAGEFPD